MRDGTGLFSTMTARGSVTGLRRCRPWFKHFRLGKCHSLAESKVQWIILCWPLLTLPLRVSCQERVVKRRPSHHVLLPEMNVPETGTAKVSLLGHVFAVVHATVL